MKHDRQIILVSGCPRSGTTTIGDVLNTAPKTAAIYEPMNFHSGDRVINHYFEAPGTAEFSKQDFDDLTRRIAKLELNLKSGVWPEDKGVRRIAKYLVGGRSRASLRKAKWMRKVDAVIWKDPIAAFSMRQFIEQNHGQAVISYRSPYAVAASFKRMKWGFKLNDIFPRLEKAGVKTPDGWRNADISDHVTNAALLWATIYGDQLSLAQEHPDKVTVIDLDDIIRNPLVTYQNLFKKLSLPWTDRTQKHLRQIYTDKSVHQSDVPSGHAHSKKRDVSQANQYWRKTLTEEEIAVVKQWTT
ncbi:sulfotransferase [Celeribacter halophilus]|uniref:sulfotransferase domain-containing protein n=1 Tax=Celeribacter halophilus TaxID=576117 RepID=UPI0026E134C2|nr:sulfotransferase domain-containing protein [Celeribacter halophilus]MDO6724799.1 sulfotransferase [Celeribacter halophilus]